MARPREQAGGWVKSKSTWTVEYREYSSDGSSRKVCEFIGLKSEMGVREAERRRKDFMADVNNRNRRPSSMMTLSQFWAARFESQVVWKKKPSGQKHYRYCWRKLEPLVGHQRLTDVDVETVEDVVRLMFERGYATQSVLHFKNCLSAMFRHAKKLKLYRDDNPAGLVDLPEVRHERRPTYTAEQLRIALAHLPVRAKIMATLSVYTSLGPAEMAGLTLGGCNLTPVAREVDGVWLAPYSLWVRENVYEGKRGSLKAGSRQRIVGIPSELGEQLAELVATSPRQDPGAPLFQSRNGTPVDTHNIANRVFRKLKLGFPVSWYAFRRAHSTMAAALPGVTLDDRQRTMGHADAGMTTRYNVADVERMRAISAGIAEQLENDPLSKQSKGDIIQ